MKSITAALKSKARQVRKNLRYMGVSVDKTTKTVNAYHCCTHKSASQWIRGILSDKRIYQYSGLKPFNYYNEWYDGTDPRPLEDRRFTNSFPQNTIATPLYLNYQSYCSIPKPTTYKAFFVFRDPRDIVVSWYFYMKSGNYVPSDTAKDIEKKLLEKTMKGGLLYSIEYLSRIGLFRQQESWLKNKDNKHIILVDFAKLTGDKQLSAFKRIFNHLNVKIDTQTLKSLVDDHSFDRKSGGREKGDEDKSSHYRKGKSGDWKRHLDIEIVEQFQKEIEELTYLKKRLRW